MASRITGILYHVWICVDDLMLTAGYLWHLVWRPGQYPWRLHEGNVAVNMAGRAQHPSVLNMRRDRAVRWTDCPGTSQRTQFPRRAPLRKRLSLFLPFLAHLSSGNLVPPSKKCAFSSMIRTVRTCVIETWSMPVPVGTFSPSRPLSRPSPE